MSIPTSPSQDHGPSPADAPAQPAPGLPAPELLTPELLAPVLLEERDGGLVILTLNRPDKLNAFTPELHRALGDALTRIEHDPGVRALLLTGAGRGFCAGQDLSQRDPAAGQTPDLGETIGTYYNPLIRRLRAWTRPKICAVNGVAAGAGASLALACDIVLAAQSAKFIMAFARIGLVPDSGATWAYTHRLGEARAKALTLLAEPLPAETAAAWGLIWQAVPDEALMDRARALGRQLAEGPTLGLSHTIQAIQAAGTNTLDQQLDLERDAQQVLGRTADYAEGVAAFLAKRPARFRGA